MEEGKKNESPVKVGLQPEQERPSEDAGDWYLKIRLVWRENGLAGVESTFSDGAFIGFATREENVVRSAAEPLTIEGDRPARPSSWRAVGPWRADYQRALLDAQRRTEASPSGEELQRSDEAIGLRIAAQLIYDMSEFWQRKPDGLAALADVRRAILARAGRDPDEQGIGIGIAQAESLRRNEAAWTSPGHLTAAANAAAQSEEMPDIGGGSRRNEAPPNAFIVAANEVIRAARAYGYGAEIAPRDFDNSRTPLGRLETALYALMAAPAPEQRRPEALDQEQRKTKFLEDYAAAAVAVLDEFHSWPNDQPPVTSKTLRRLWNAYLAHALGRAVSKEPPSEDAHAGALLEAQNAETEAINGFVAESVARIRTEEQNPIKAWDAAVRSERKTYEAICCLPCVGCGKATAYRLVVSPSLIQACCEGSRACEDKILNESDAPRVPTDAAVVLREDFKPDRGAASNTVERTRELLRRMKEAPSVPAEEQEVGDAIAVLLGRIRTYDAALCDEMREALNRYVALGPRRTTLREQVTAFHKRFGHPVGDKPHVPSDEIMRFRMSLIFEEFCELFDSVFSDAPYPSSQLADAMRAFRDCINGKYPYLLASVKVNLPELADALADLDYVIEGTRVTMGIDGAPIANLVHQANMAKDPVYVASKDEHHRKPDPAAKPKKPAGWAPPDVEGELKRQGWTYEAIDAGGWEAGRDSHESQESPFDHREKYALAPCSHRECDVCRATFGSNR